MYSTAVDMWALGCLMPELYTGRPLFPGTSELNQLLIIAAVKGSPTEETWPQGMQMARNMRINLPNHEAKSWNEVCPGVSDKAMQLMEDMLRWDPHHRVTAKDALNYPLFQIELLE